MSLYKNKYRIESTRLKNWNYSHPGYYFVTICTKNREHYLGRIINEKMHLSEIGAIVEQEWQTTITLRQDMKITTDVFAIMPNHFHAIFCIHGKEAMHRVFTNNVATFGPQSKNLASVIRGFKSAVTTMN
jgi:putative transposase